MPTLTAGSVLPGRKQSVQTQTSCHRLVSKHARRSELCRKAVCTKVCEEMNERGMAIRRGVAARRGEARRGEAQRCLCGTETNLHVLSFNSSCLDLQSNCVNLQEHLQVRRSCTNKLFLLSEQGEHWLQGKQKGERERAKLWWLGEISAERPDRHSCTPPHQ